MRCSDTVKARDGYHMSHPHPEGAGAIRAMRQALNRAGLQPADIDYINLHGTATRANDTVEDKAVHGIFGRRLPQLDEGMDRAHARGGRNHGSADLGAMPYAGISSRARSTASGWIRLVQPDFA